jgi:hypothetical protein
MKLSKNAEEKASGQGLYKVRSSRGNLLCKEGVIQKISVSLNLLLVELKLMGT